MKFVILAIRIFIMYSIILTKRFLPIEFAGKRLHAVDIAAVEHNSPDVTMHSIKYLLGDQTTNSPIAIRIL